MARMLDVLEIFLNHHDHTYLRLDGATPVQKRQVGKNLSVVGALAAQARGPGFDSLQLPVLFTFLDLYLIRV